MKVLLVLSLFVCAITCADVGGPALKLRTGFNMPQVGLGTWQTSGDATAQAVRDALEIGYRHIDTAEDYRNEADVGKGLWDQINKGILKREDVFITSKVGGWTGSNREKALQAVHNSLKYMNITYIDLMLVHFPYTEYVSAYQGLEDAYDQKLVRSLGVSNFQQNQIENLLKTAKVKPSVNQVTMQPGNGGDGLIAYCKTQDIAITAYSPLGTGGLISNPILMNIGKKYNKTAAQVALHWGVQRGTIVIPKSTHKNYIEEDFKIFDFTLTDEEMKEVHDLKKSSV